MSRLQQNRIIDSAIEIVTVTESQCSLSGIDLYVLNEALTRLQSLRRKKGKTNEQIRQEIAEVMLTLVEFFAVKRFDAVMCRGAIPSTP